MRTFLLSSCAALTLLPSVPVYAQGTDSVAPEASDEGTDEIIVTARQREERLLDVPVPVSVATQAQLTRDQVYTVTDLQRVTPALEVSQTSGGQNNGGARLRGLGTGVFNASVSPSVAFLLDNVPQGNLAFPELFDLAQVEVLRGPQGTLFGQGASAGVIKVATVAPSTEAMSATMGFDYADKGTAGSEFGQLVVRAAFNVPLSDDIAVRVAGQMKRESGLQRNVTIGRDHEINNYSVRARLLARPTENLTINLNAEYNKFAGDGYNFFALAIAPTGRTNSAASLAAYTSPTGGCRQPVSERAEFYCAEVPNIESHKAFSVSGIADLELGDLTLTSVTAYRTIDRNIFAHEFSRLVGFPSAREENTFIKSKQFSQELRAAYSNGGVDFIFGGLYSKYDADKLPIVVKPFGLRTPGNRTGFSVCLNSGTVCSVPPSFTREDTSNTTIAAFADATFELSSQFDLFGGIRYTDYKNTSGVGANTLIATRFRTIKDKDVSGRLGARFSPSSSTTIYGSLAKGYKPPAVVVPVSALQPIIDLKPEIATAFELGAKTSFGRFQLEGNIFHTSVEDFQSQTSVFVGTALVSQARNIDKVVSKGFELTAFGRLSDNLTITGGYQFNSVKFPRGFVGDDGVDIGGRQFLNAPKHKATFSGEFAQPISGDVEAFFNMNAVYKSKVLLITRSDPRFNYRAHVTLGGALGVRDADGQWTASLFVRNLTKQREPSGYLASTFLGAVDGGIRAYPVGGLTARQVGVSANLNF